MLVKTLSLILLFTLLGCIPKGDMDLSFQEEEEEEPTFEGPMSLTAVNGIDLGMNMNYYISYPLGYDYYTSKTWPVLVYLHGYGRRGDYTDPDWEAQLDIMKAYGLSYEIDLENWDSDLPFIVIMPQLPNTVNVWADEYLQTIMEDIFPRYRVDYDKVYITGSSLGGDGTMRFAKLYPTQTSAIIPISPCNPGGYSLDSSCNISQVPGWYFYGGSDNCEVTDSATHVQSILDTLNACAEVHSSGSEQSVIAGLGHVDAVWNGVYENTHSGVSREGYTDIYEWLLSHQF